MSAGIPGHKNRFSYHEFSHLPVNWHETLSAEMEMLMASGLVPLKENLPMHITLGGVASGKDIGIALSLIQLSGGSNTERLLRPNKRNGSWNCKGQCGIKPRKPEDLEGRYFTGVELRTLAANCPEQVRQTVKYAQLLGVAIMAYQAEEKDDLSQELSDSWVEIKGKILNNVLVPYGLNRWWPSPTEDKKEWKLFSSLYGQPETEKFLEDTSRDIDQIESMLIQKLAA